MPNSVCRINVGAEALTPKECSEKPLTREGLRLQEGLVPKKCAFKIQESIARQSVVVGAV
jgi:hypothetical protein